VLSDGRGAGSRNRELERRAGVSESAVQREMGKLTRLDLVRRRAVRKHAPYLMG